MEKIRRSLHRYPELAYQENQTSKLICRQLDRLQISYSKGLANTGIRAELGSGKPCVALRADMDALPINEETGLDFSSAHAGVMHACGHDGHVAMLLGAAEILAGSEFDGQIVLLFQPAEESGNGAEAMIADNCLQDVEMIFSGHIDTHYPTGQLTVDQGLICSYTDPFTLQIHGRGGHAAKPHEAVDTVVAGSSLIMNLQTIVSRRINPTRPAVVTVGRFSAGTVHNVIAEEAVLEGTIRSAHPETREQIFADLKHMIQGIEEMYRVSIRLDLHDGLPAVINDAAAAAIARQAGKEVAGADQVISQSMPSLGGEDFSFYQQHIPGCMIRYGAAKIPEAGNAHSSRFDFDEQVLSIGAEWLATVAIQGLHYLQVQKQEQTDYGTKTTCFQQQ
jgi:hippurate hydrolase